MNIHDTMRQKETVQDLAREQFIAALRRIQDLIASTDANISRAIDEFESANNTANLCSALKTFSAIHGELARMPGHARIDFAHALDFAQMLGKEASK